MRTPRYQYMLYGLHGEFMGITTSRKIAQAHAARGDWAYYRRIEYDAADPDWQRARKRGLPCE